MVNENKRSLMNLRLKQARECLESAEREIDADSYRGAANRSYYCIFHAMRAVLASDSFDSKKHTGIISAFRERYIKTGVFPTKFSDFIRTASKNRGDSDYDDFFIISKEDVAQQIGNAKAILTAAEAHIKTL